jgi:hypothetical protein
MCAITLVVSILSSVPLLVYRLQAHVANCQLMHTGARSLHSVTLRIKNKGYNMSVSSNISTVQHAT